MKKNDLREKLFAKKYIDSDTFEIRDNVFEVDGLMAEAISILNKKGYKTRYCCSGHIDNSIHSIKLENDKVENIIKTEDTQYEIVKKGDYSIVYFKTPGTRTYIMFDKDYNFKTIPKGFEKENKTELKDGRYIDVEDEYDVIYKMVYFYSDGVMKDEEVILNEIYDNNKLFLEWAKGLPER